MSATRRAGRRLRLVVPVLATNFLPLPALADETECNSAYTEVQLLRRESKLLAAQAQAIRCGQDQCSVTVRTDCARWLDEVERALPSLVVKAQDDTGADLVDVTVRAGSEVVAERLHGRPLVLDPGEYRFSFEYQSSTIERRIVIHEGEKYRILSVRFQGNPTQPEPEEEPAPPRPRLRRDLLRESHAPAPIDFDRPLPSTKRPVPAASYALTVLAGIAGAAFIGLAGSGYLSEKKLRHSCAAAHTCNARDIDSVKARYLAADVALGFSVLSLASAGAVWLFTPAPDRPVDLPVPEPALQGWGYSLSGRF